MRAAVVIEQCWHRVPGGTARAVLDQVQAVVQSGQVDQVGVAARHRHPPAPAWRPEIPVRHLPLPRLALYRTWHRWRWPAVERATGGRSLAANLALLEANARLAGEIAAALAGPAAPRAGGVPASERPASVVR